SSLSLAKLDFGDSVSNDVSDVWADLSLNASVSAVAGDNTITLNGIVPLYDSELNIEGDDSESVTGRNIWAFYVELDNLRSDVTGVTVTADNCVAKVDYTNKRLYIAGSHDQIKSENVSVKISDNATGHDEITLTIQAGEDLFKLVPTEGEGGGDNGNLSR
ncbi:MAG: hypothetical protein WDA26_09840, partial [Pusillimonas sp.]